VVPIFIEQLKKKQPITITNKDMVRYFMTVKQAIKLIFKSAQISQGGEVFILKMSALKLTDLINVLIEEFSAGSTKHYPIKEIGVRPGEKIVEKLITSTEENYALESDDMYIIPPLIENLNSQNNVLPQKIAYYKNNGAKSFNKERLKKLEILSVKQIKQLLKEAKLIN
jgi:FlaA1/EpsC-like NDP-sugar epimerase